ncbi:redoxin family protein, partial [Nitrospinaceae bacterium]|nr:redoxin family protein [Nitrospinaceae bacterium]
FSYNFCIFIDGSTSNKSLYKNPKIGGFYMAKLSGSNVKMIKLNPEWSVEKAATTPIEQELSIDDYKGKRLIITLPGAGGFCNKEFDLVKDNDDKFKAAGVDEVIVVVGTDILSNAGRGLPNLLQDVSQEFGNANKLTLEGVKSRYLNRAIIAVDASGEEVAREDADLLGCRTVDALVDVAKKAFA